ncbi:MAG: YbhB/YbcL family Raf kinase inhibitor-like protein [Caulobacterales bacterium]
MWLKSDGWGDGGFIPRRYTCDGEDLSPPLDWGDARAGARSLVILCEDPDAPGGIFHHWAVYDISAGRSALSEGAASEGRLSQGVNDFGRSGYGGPCPPHGDGPHRYRFRLLAVSSERLAVPGRPSCRSVERAAQGSALEEAILVGRYAR